MKHYRGRSRGAVKWWTLTAAVLGTFMLMLDLSVVNIALPVIRRDLNVSFEKVQWVLDAYALTLAVFLLTAGALADTFGRKKLFQIGFAAVGSLFQNRVTRQFSGSAVGRQLSAVGVDTHSLGVTIANGGARQIVGAIPSPLRLAFADSAGSVFSSSMHLCFIVLATISACCGVVALLFVRMRDLRNEAPQEVIQVEMSEVAK